MYAKPTPTNRRYIHSVITLIDRIDPCTRRYGRVTNIDQWIDDYIDPILRPIAAYLRIHDTVPCPQWYADLVNARGELLRGNLDTARKLLVGIAGSPHRDVGI